MFEKENTNPWLSIPATEYEGHMGPRGTDQLRVLNDIFRNVYRRVKPANLAVLGCAMGNGFEHIDRGLTQWTVGVDLNPRYLELARRRYAHLLQTIELRCANLSNLDFEAQSFDMIHAALIFEYLDIEAAMAKFAAWLAPEGVLSVVLQEPSTNETTVSHTQYNSMQTLVDTIELIRPEALEDIANQAGLLTLQTNEIPLRHGKKFYTAMFMKQLRT